MKYTLSILLVIASFGDLDRIAKVNKLKKEAKQAYQAGDFSTAISKYHYLLDSMSVDDHRLRLNLANAYYQSNDTTNALNHYGAVTESSLKVIKSTAYQQTGIIQHQQEKHKEALDSFKLAIKANPANEDARYNYEMLKKFLREQEQKQDQQKQDQDNKENKDEKDQDKKDQQKQDQKDKDKQEEKKDQEKQDKEGEQDEEKDKEGEEEDAPASDTTEKEEEKDAKEGEQKPEEMPDSAEQKMKEMKISEEKAKMILEALKNQEVQYIQQNRKKAKKRPKSNKPDW